ncbi:N-acetyltransferase [Nonomuraea sp. NPDC050328]|uniref:N-acetyltransferase n=1 Tax=Nonomuraea sp. NPDC050328 TaxID=3364361 RepID=UPI0037AF851A
MALRVTTLAERPHLADATADMPSAWPTFMLNDPMADLYYPFCARDHAEHILVADDDTDPDVPVARAYTVPFALAGDELPDDGWDGVIRRSHLAKERGRERDRISALEISIRPDLLGKGLSGVMLDAMRGNAIRLGFSELVAPVRPNQKHVEPETPMEEYAFRIREDGLPYDAWLRVHVRAGARIAKVAPRSMTISGTLDEWRGWTGLPFDTPGQQIVPKALSPVHVDLVQDHAVYVEPNVWVVHTL